MLSKFVPILVSGAIRDAPGYRVWPPALFHVAHPTSSQQKAQSVSTCLPAPCGCFRHRGVFQMALDTHVPASILSP